MTSASDSRQWMTTGRSREGQFQVPPEHRELEVEGRPVPVAVEPCLAYGHDTRFGREGDHALPIARRGLGGLVGMDADGREHAGMAPGQGENLGAPGGRRADGHHLDDPGRACPVEHSRQVTAQARIVQVRMRVDQGYHP